ncbi:hypothetical protein GQ600_14183 [Phytophthora cactorum]|nr:hypothetical protein GQ600_14183 [Phytophthora cactorum]
MAPRDKITSHSSFDLLYVMKSDPDRDTISGKSGDGGTAARDGGQAQALAGPARHDGRAADAGDAEGPEVDGQAAA